jgi:hypothetical protein
MTRISHSPKIRPMTREGSATLADTADIDYLRVALRTTWRSSI